MFVGCKVRPKLVPRLFHRDEWFDQLSPKAFSEAEFETLLRQHADIIRADSIIVPFKKTVYAGPNSARADLAIIPRDYRTWVVVEVEMSHHGLYSHVLPQVRTLRDALYGQDLASYLLSKSPTLDAAKIGDMLRGDPPDVLVLVNKFDEEWDKELRRYGAHLMVFEVFRSKNNRHIFSIDGGPPRVAQNFLSELSFSLLPRCLSVASPAALDFPTGRTVPILIDDQMTYWERFHTATEVYLTPIGSMPISPGSKYALVLLDGGQHEIRPLGTRGSQ